jgi:hypothetical protein
MSKPELRDPKSYCPSCNRPGKQVGRHKLYWLFGPIIKTYVCDNYHCALLVDFGRYKITYNWKVRF